MVGCRLVLQPSRKHCRRNRAVQSQPLRPRRSQSSLQLKLPAARLEYKRHQRPRSLHHRWAFQLQFNILLLLRPYKLLSAVVSSAVQPWQCLTPRHGPDLWRNDDDRQTKALRFNSVQIHRHLGCLGEPMFLSSWHCGFLGTDQRYVSQEDAATEEAAAVPHVRRSQLPVPKVPGQLRLVGGGACIPAPAKV